MVEKKEHEHGVKEEFDRQCEGCWDWYQKQVMEVVKKYCFCAESTGLVDGTKCKGCGKERMVW